jgi:hypothetical protein
MFRFSETSITSIAETSASQTEVVLTTITTITLTLTDTEMYTAIITTAATISRDTEIQTTIEDSTTLTPVIIFPNFLLRGHSRLHHKATKEYNHDQERNDDYNEDLQDKSKDDDDYY